MLGELLRDERLPGRKFSDASHHELAGIIIGQLERVISLLTRQHAEHPPIAASTTLAAANTPVIIYTARYKVYIRMMALSASASCNITLSTQHPTTGPLLQAVFVANAAAAGPVPIGEHEFVMPADATLWLQADQAATIQVTASVYDGAEPSLIMNFEQ